ncbi:MAG: class I SAM-dependent methyltransferase [Defluviitaleaceae bacterium]|nr:class I SAM-dependent methyltransferase [Defluviitaleaceae bacterium]MCL2835817.1 class I SAM-dependent methyltransferase [Defluviitaleaceae bacterium]
MDETTKIVMDYYDAEVEREWNRIAGRPEYLLTCRMLDRYIKPGNSVLDIGGGPGRYSVYLAEKGCSVTLFDLSAGNTKYGKERAAELGLSISTVTGDAREADKLVNGQFDHVLLMGPMYHLLDEADRVNSVKASINLLKPGGVMFVSFINMMGGIIYGMKFMPEIIASTAPCEIEFIQSVIDKRSYAGDAFTKAFFIEQSELLPFMAQFPLEKLHLFGQEGIVSPCEPNIMSQPKEIIDLWLDLSEKLWDREELLSWSEHLMYVGRKL